MNDSASARDDHGDLPTVFTRLATKGNKPPHAKKEVQSRFLENLNNNNKERNEAKPPRKHKFLQKGEKTKNLPYGAPIRPHVAHQGGGGGSSSSS